MATRSERLELIIRASSTAPRRSLKVLGVAMALLSFGCLSPTQSPRIDCRTGDSRSCQEAAAKALSSITEEQGTPARAVVTTGTADCVHPNPWVCPWTVSIEFRPGSLSAPPATEVHVMRSGDGDWLLVNVVKPTR